MSNTVQLKGLDLFMYLMKRFGSTPEQALETMKEHNQDVTEVEKLMREVKQKQKEKGVTDETINKRDKS